MLILIEKNAPPRRTETSTDRTFEAAELKKREEEDRWVRHIIKGLAGSSRE